MADDVVERYREKFEEKHAKMHTEGLDWLPVLMNLGVVTSGYIYAGWTGFFIGLYLVTGASLARSTQNSIPPQFLTAVFWPLLLVINVAMEVDEE